MAAGISGQSRADLARLTGHGRRFVTVTDATAELHLDRGDAARRLARWAEQGWLRRVRRDLYIPVPVDATDPSSWGGDPLVLADAVWHPCYVTGWTAANHWGLTEQSFRTTVIKTTQRVRQSAQSLLDNEFLVAHTAADNLEWGMRREWREERRIRLADPARAVVDMLDDPRLGAGIRTVAECLDAYFADEDPATLVTHADRLGNRTVFKRLGYLAERLSADPALLAACEGRLSEGFSVLDPTQARSGPRSHRWRLVVNVRLGDVASS
jgi:predicted transcriptional regulator of viral defense system